MKNQLRLLIVVGIAWLIGLGVQQTVVPVVMIDAILPPDVLAMTTAQQREQIEKKLRQAYAPRWISWSGALAVLFLSVQAFVAANKRSQ
jgi:hypothetical protein